MNCPKCKSKAGVYSRAHVDGKPVRRRQCKDKDSCGIRFGCLVLDNGNEELIRIYDEVENFEVGVKQKRKKLDYAAAWSEIRKAAIGTMFIPWRPI